MYLIIWVELADDHFGIDLTQLNPHFRIFSRKNDFHIFVPSDLTSLWTSNLLP